MYLAGKCSGRMLGSSLELNELEQLVKGVQFIKTAQSNPVDKDDMASELSAMRGLFTKSLVASSNISAGQTLSRELVTAKKPGSGIPVESADDYFGRILAIDVSAGHYLEEGDFIPVVKSS